VLAAPLSKITAMRADNRLDLDIARARWLELVEAERNLTECIAGQVAGAPILDELERKLGEIRCHLGIAKSRLEAAALAAVEDLNGYQCALERQLEEKRGNEARRAVFRVVAGDRGQDDPVFVGFEEPAIVPVNGGEGS
jgi:hypothetical protein